MPGRKDGNLKSLLEAALFISSRPLMLDDIGKTIGVHSLGHVKHLLEDLQKEYSERGIEIANTPQGWQMHVNSSVLPTVAHLTPYSDIPEGCKRTLALVIYKEPLKQSELVKIQGNKAYAYIKFLEKKGLIKSEKFSRTKLLKVTKEFETYFGEPKDKIKERIAKGIGTLEKEEIKRRNKPEVRDERIEKLKEIEGMNDFFARIDKPVSVQKATKAEPQKTTEPFVTKPIKKSKLPSDLDELSVNDFKIVKKEK